MPDTIAPAQTTESSGNEIERANVPGETTDVTEATLPQITILDRETVPTGVLSVRAILRDCMLCFCLIDHDTYLACKE